VGDIFPYGGPAYVTWQDAYAAMFTLGFGHVGASIFAAIGEAESSLDYRVINDTPSTGDYSVGIWQINYYNGLYAGRAKAYGTPKQLVQGGLARQARAAKGVWEGQGFSAWSTFNSGAYLKYLHGASGPPPGPIPGAPNPPGAFTVPPPRPTANDDWHVQVTQSGLSLRQIAANAHAQAKRVTKSYH
jgi:hypothetical protein